MGAASLRSALVSLGNAIRSKTGKTSAMTIPQMASAINGMNAGDPYSSYGLAMTGSFSLIDKSYLFNENAYLSAVSLPNVTQLSAFMFNGCSNLVYASIPKLTSAPERLFYNCNRLNTLCMPLISTIEYAAFCSVPGITEITDSTFPNLKSIGSWAFRNASGLRLVSLTKQSSIFMFVDNVFAGCSSLSKVVLKNLMFGQYNLSMLFTNCSNLSLVYLHFSANGNNKLGNMTFNGCDSRLQLYISCSYLIQAMPYTFASSDGTTVSPFKRYTTASIYVPSSLYSNYIKASYYSAVSARIVSLSKYGWPV